MRKSTALILTVSLAAAAHAQGNDPGAPSVYAITDAKIVTAPGKVIASGTLVLRDGRIESVGERVKVPSDAKVISGKGLTLYPGLINASTRLGMPTEAVKSDRGDRYPIAAIQAENTAALLFKPDLEAIKPYRQAGFGIALTAPMTGLIQGTSAAISLSESDKVNELILKSATGMHLSFERGSFGEYPGSLMGQLAATRQALYDAQFKGGKGTPTRTMQALQPVVEKKLPLIIKATGAREIERALKLCKEFGLTPIIDGGTEAYAVAQKLKDAHASVFLSADLPAAPTTTPGEPSTETLQSLRARALAPTAATALARLGVPFALTTNTPADLLKNTRKLIAAGLTEEQALTALTLSPAKLLGIEKQTGTLEPGKLANVVVVEGDSLFAPKAKLAHVFIDGKPVVLSAPGAATAGGARVAAAAAPAVDIKKSLPPGVTPEMALQFLKADPEAAKPFLPAGVTVEQAIAALEGKPAQAPAAPTGAGAAQEEKPFVLSKVGAGQVPPTPPALASKSFVLRNATVWTSAAAGILKETDVLVRDGKLAAIGKDLKVPSGTVEVEGRGKHVTPGMIDAHSHTAVAGSVNEGSNIVTAEVRIADVLNPDDVNIYRQLAGGTTAANILHGSANAIGGQNAVVKWRWGVDSADDLLIDSAPQGIKFALGENPTRSNGGFPRDGSPRYPSSRMGVERVIRAKFIEARDYAAKRKADPEHTRRDLQLDAIVEILEGKRLVHCHSYVASEILMLIRLADEFGIKIATFQHVLEGYKVADEIAKHGAGGSTFTDWWGYKLEAYDAIPWNAALMTERGVNVSLNSDSNELARRLNTEAAKAVRWGSLSPAEALKLVTINPAKQLHIDKLTGSLEIGKDADLVLWSGDPLSPLSMPEKTFVDGKLLFDRQADLAARKELEEEKARLTKELAGTTTPPASPRPTSEPEKATPARPNALPQLPARARVQGTPVAQLSAETDKPIALLGGTIHTVSGADIEDGFILIDKGQIVQVGPRKGVSVPGGLWNVINVTGMHIYPGLIDANTSLGTYEIDSRRETQDNQEQGTYQPELFIAHVINPDSEAIKVARAEGILSALVAPQGGTLSGMGALINLDGWTWEELTLNPLAGLLATLPGGGGGGRRFGEEEHLDDADRAGSAQPPAVPGPGRRGPGGPLTPASGGAGTADPLQPVTDFLEQARRYKVARDAEKTGAPRHDRDPKFEAMLPVLEGAVPAYIRADRKKEIETAVRWAKKEGFKLVIVGAGEADECAELLVKENVPVILGPTLSLPRRLDAPYDDAFTLPARLAKAGVRFAITTPPASEGDKSRNLAQHAAMAAAFGLTRDEALKSITLGAAQILGAGDRLGSIEPGKDANLVVTNGDILEVMTQVRQAFVAGKPVSLSSKQSGLYERWRARPKTK
ncbi:amidohydrolase family protein [Armatimonas rosea]|uniref:Imidazolonepropionase-like amidohydrolase n=1 Tax=Armatimonas rosea TaxID=685828 RepID=A0A7W9SW26_ARMRO|nr:amidohydrolase family protein [Armatimonas rosea]MBB6053453.1 imidazolonepropionase-like amidohydrolase [Armatimonas rosea]